MQSPMNRAEVVNGAVGPFDDYCDGYGNPGSSGIGYVSVLKLSTGTVAKTMDSVLEGIVSYDRAEKNDAYAGQINMIAASSFSGLNGAVWGYDLARHDGLSDGSIKTLMTRRRSDGSRDPGVPGRAPARGRGGLVRNGGVAALPLAARFARDLRDERRHRQLAPPRCGRP